MFSGLTHCGLVRPYGHSTGSTLSQVMIWCLMTPSHYLNHHWLIPCGVLWHSHEEIFHRKCTRYLYLIWVYEWLIQDCRHIFHGWMNISGLFWPRGLSKCHNFTTFYHISLKFHIVGKNYKKCNIPQFHNSTEKSEVVTWLVRSSFLFIMKLHTLTKSSIIKQQCQWGIKLLCL